MNDDLMNFAQATGIPTSGVEYNPFDPRVRQPYTGDPRAYGQGPEHLFFADPTTQPGYEAPVDPITGTTSTADPWNNTGNYGYQKPQDVLSGDRDGEPGAGPGSTPGGVMDPGDMIGQTVNPGPAGQLGLGVMPGGGLIGAGIGAYNIGQVNKARGAAGFPNMSLSQILDVMNPFSDTTFESLISSITDIESQNLRGGGWNESKENGTRSDRGDNGWGPEAGNGGFSKAEIETAAKQSANSDNADNPQDVGTPQGDNFSGNESPGQGDPGGAPNDGPGNSGR